jgi:hypothetical protein
MRYIEGEDGNVIDGYRASEIRKFARSIWMQLANNSKAPKTWGKTDLESAKHYRQEMVRRFPELRLCAFDWKADQVATDNYPNWASTYLNTGRIKDEVLGDTESSSLNSVPAKRPHVQSASSSTSSTSEVIAKRKRTATSQAMLAPKPDSSNNKPTLQQGLGRSFILYWLF